jgi:anti-sigma factor RsiW
LVEALMDGELDLDRRDQVEAHLERCETCTASLKRLRQISDALHAHPLSFEPSAGLKQRVLLVLRKEAERPRLGERPPFLMWAGIAACALLAMAYAGTLLERRSTMQDAELIATQVLSSHVRSLMGNHMLDVPSTDQHTVKPWFDGKLDFSPNVKDFADEGFRLIGGRLDYVGGRPVAALVFQHNQHMINLFTWPSNEGTVKPTAGPPLNGYNSVRWSESGMSYWAVADVHESALEQLARLYLR